MYVILHDHGQIAHLDTTALGNASLTLIFSSVVCSACTPDPLGSDADTQPTPSSVHQTRFSWACLHPLQLALSLADVTLPLVFKSSIIQ